MATLIRSREAADILGVTPATLYAYVSRGRLRRRTAPDGRTSLYERSEVEHLAERSRRAAPGPRPTIDVQITSTVTEMDDAGLAYRGHDVANLATEHRFEDVAELLWTGELTGPVTWPTATPTDVATCAPIGRLELSPIGRIAVAAQALDRRHPDDTPADAARRLLLQVPVLYGSTRRGGRYAARLAGAWRRRPEPAFVDAVDRALVLLADHELATSTLAVRIAASVRASPYVAMVAGLAAVEGVLHGSAAAMCHRLLSECAAGEPVDVIADHRRERRPIPGFGHKVYRSRDPRFVPLLDAVRTLDADGSHVDLVDHVVAEVGRVLPHQPNVDLALGALSWTAGLPADTPIFAVARIAGWMAHYAEEIAERPVRYRGVARPG